VNVAKIVSELRAGAPFFTLFKMMKGVFDDKYEAEKLYKELIPVLQDFLMQGRRFNDPQVQHLVNILRELPQYGAQRRNFEKLYLQDEYGLRKLPKDPNDIPYGHWH
jgi:hypothetical protein